MSNQQPTMESVHQENILLKARLFDAGERERANAEQMGLALGQIATAAGIDLSQHGQHISVTDIVQAIQAKGDHTASA